jgi:ribonuclease Z
VDEKYSKVGISVSSHDIKEGVIFEKNGVKVTAFLVDHGPVKPAVGYRVDYGGHSVTLSGDTRFSENLIKYSQGVDVIIHETIDADALRASPGKRTKEQIENTISHHTTLDKAGIVFSRIKPRLAVYSHFLGTPERLVAGTRKTYSGPLVVGEDLMTIEIGDRVEVRHFPQK